MPRATPKKFLTLIVFALISVLAIDVGISISMGGRYSANRSPFIRYLEYGVSVSTKLQVLLEKSEYESGGIAKAGWYEFSVKELGELKAPCQKVAIYGMSFSNRVAAQIRKLSPCILTRVVSGPASPISHSLYQYRRDRQSSNASHVVLGVLASSVPMLLASSHATHSYEYPSSVIYPRYRLKKGSLYAHPLPVDSFNGFKEQIASPNGLSKLKEYLQRNDEFYNHAVFGHEWADHSMVLRFLRRYIAQKLRRQVIDRAYDGSRFRNYLQLREIAHAVLYEFVGEVISDGKVPIVLLIHDRRYSGALDELYADHLASSSNGFLTTSTMIDSSNHKNFLVDGHFTVENDELIARELLKLLDEG